MKQEWSQPRGSFGTLGCVEERDCHVTARRNKERGQVLQSYILMFRSQKHCRNKAKTVGLQDLTPFFLSFVARIRPASVVPPASEMS